MDTVQGLFCGHKAFVSKKSNKRVFILSFLTLTQDEMNDRTDYYVADVFVSEEKYAKFLEEHKLLADVPLERDIVGDKIRYYI